MMPEFVVGAALDGRGKAHLVSVNGWRAVCGTTLAASWLPEFGASVTCQLCRRTVAYAAFVSGDETDTAGARARPDAWSRSAALRRRAQGTKAQARASRAHHRRLSADMHALLRARHGGTLPKPEHGGR